MTRLRLALGLLLLALLGQAAGAQVPDSGAAPPLTLDAAIARALAANFDLRMTRTLVDSAQAELRTARAIPNPVVSGIPNSPYQYSATLPLDVGPQRSTRTAVATRGIEAARLDTRNAERQLAATVARAWYDVLLADAHERITIGRRDVVRELLAADSARVHAGDIPERALFRSQVELVRADGELARARIDAESTRLTLQGLMGVEHPDPALRLAGTLSAVRARLATSDSALAEGVARRADVQAARVRESQAADAQRFARALAIPIPQLSVVHQFAEPFSNGSYTSFGIGFELPVLNQYGGQRDRAAAGRLAAEAASRRTLAVARQEAVTARAVYLAQRALVERYEAGVITQAEQQVAATRYAYGRGAASLLEVLDALRTQQDVLTDYYTALHDYGVSVFVLRAATGL